MYNDSFHNRYDNYPYMARNMLVKKAEILVQQPIIDDTTAEAEKGYLALGVFTALGALPVANAAITVYETLVNGEQLIDYLKKHNFIYKIGKRTNEYHKFY